MFYILGSSGHAKVIIEILELTNQSIDGVWDDNYTENTFEGYKVVGKILDAPINEKDSCIIAIGNNTLRKKISENIKSGYSLAIHDRSNISQSVTVSPGTVVMAGATINSDCNIGKHVIINTNSSIDHDCVLGDFVHVSPNVAMAGNVTVGEGTHIGIGACVIQGINIGKWAIIGAGTVIIKDVPDYATVVGNPGKIIKISANYE